MLNDRKIIQFDQPVSSLADKPQMTASALKAAFDANTNQVKPALNGLIDDLQAAEAAGQLGFAATAGVQAGTVQAAIESVQQQVVNTALGEVPDGSIGAVKLADEVQAQIAGATAHVTDAGAHAELFGDVNARFDGLSSASVAKVGDIVQTTSVPDNSFIPCDGRYMISTNIPYEFADKIGYRFGAPFMTSKSGNQAQSQGYAPIFVTDTKIVVLIPITNTTGSTAVRWVFDRNSMSTEVAGATSALSWWYYTVPHGGRNAVFGETLFMANSDTDTYSSLVATTDYGVNKISLASLLRKTPKMVSTPHGVLVFLSTTTEDSVQEARLYTNPANYTPLTFKPGLTLSADAFTGGSDIEVTPGYSLFILNQRCFAYNHTNKTISTISGTGTDIVGLCVLSDGYFLTLSSSGILKKYELPEDSLYAAEIKSMQLDITGLSSTSILSSSFLRGLNSVAMLVNAGKDASNNTAAAYSIDIKLWTSTKTMFSLYAGGSFALSGFGGFGIDRSSSTSFQVRRFKEDTMRLPDIKPNGVFFIKASN